MSTGDQRWLENETKGSGRKQTGYKKGREGDRGRERTKEKKAKKEKKAQKKDGDTGQATLDRN